MIHQIRVGVARGQVEASSCRHGVVTIDTAVVEDRLNVTAKADAPLFAFTVTAALVVVAILLTDFLFPLALLIVANILTVVRRSGSGAGTNSPEQRDSAQNAQQTKNRRAMT
ncbi:MAG TPA: hypothetical protein VEM39_08085 [Myxococcaceae bacterium]|nr:hypothetical protein [Myxococcaceae bacterium]